MNTPGFFNEEDCTSGLQRRDRADSKNCRLEVSGLDRGNLYCLTPETLMEANSRLVPAEDVYERIEDGKTLYARTHEGNHKEIRAAARRDRVGVGRRY